MSVHSPALHRTIVDDSAGVGTDAIEHRRRGAGAQINKIDISSRRTVVREYSVFVTPATDRAIVEDGAGRTARGHQRNCA